MLVISRNVRRAPTRTLACLLAAAIFLRGAEATRGDTDIRRDAVVEAVAKALPSVVNVATESVVQSSDPFDAVFREFYGLAPRSETRSSIGSGVIITPDGYLLTNLHVVNHASRIQVKLSDEAGGGEYDVEPNYTVVPHSDVAVLKIVPHHKGETFTAAPFAKDDDLLLGETVIALGNPFGLGVSVSRGILSSKRRAIPKENENLTQENWLQTDALINPGNSGGPLIDTRGNLIGINVAIMAGAQGIGFAIPIKEVRQALGEIFVPETASRWMGAKVVTSGPVVVDSVEAGSPSDRAGLRRGDQIVALDGHDPGDFVSFYRSLRESSSMKHDLTALRDGKRVNLSLQLEGFAEFFRERLGASLAEITPPLADRLGVSSGLLVSAVDDDGPAARAGLRENMVIDQIDGSSIEDYYHAFLVLDPLKHGDVVEVAALAPRVHGDVILGYRQGVTKLKLR